jgi:1-aminocyclopropane-1-carboxylate deaminase/D-cysteine desulfhydrase-like pyridoxal-dependent ACC family enzyme
LKEEESIVNRMLRELESGESRLLFVHNGGVEGNATQLERYERAGLN